MSNHESLYDPPWEARYDADEDRWYVGSGIIIVANHISNHDQNAPSKGFEIRKAKAQLMAAAPELLVQLKKALDILRAGTPGSDAAFLSRHQWAYNAIAKAEGRNA